jgi:IclR family transcriptional regulator, acetate operon repressor
MTAREDGETRVGGVQAVDRALDVLEVLAESGRPMGVSEVAESAGLPQGTAHRLLRTLSLRGYVRHDASRRYALGGAASRLGEAATRSLAAGARPHLARLVQLTGETANLAVLEGDDVVYVAQVPSPHTLRMFAEVGRHVRPHSTAVGKVLLAAANDERAAAVLRRSGMPRRTERTITDVPAFLDVLERTRAQGYAVDDGEEEVGVRCVAVPVTDGRRTVAAISVSGPSERFAAEGLALLAERMQEVARAVALDVLGDGGG